MFGSLSIFSLQFFLKGGGEAIPFYFLVGNVNTSELFVCLLKMPHMTFVKFILKLQIYIYECLLINKSCIRGRKNIQFDNKIY